MKIIGTKEEIRVFEVLAHRNLLSDVIISTELKDGSGGSMYFIKYLDKPIEFEEVRDEGIEKDLIKQQEEFDKLIDSHQ